MAYSLKDLEPKKADRLRELAGLFFRLGTTAFGGPAAHVAMMEEEVVRRRGWLTREEFLDMLGATNLVPGPNSTEMAIHIGYRRAGWPGLIVAGACFIFPAALIVACLAWIYVRYGSLPAVGGILYGVKPVVIAIIAQALFSLGHTAIKSGFLFELGALALVLSAIGAGEVVLIFGAGTLSGYAKWIKSPVKHWTAPAVLLVFAVVSLLFQFVTLSHGSEAEPFSNRSLFFYFLKIGSVLYGSGYVLLAFIRADLVERMQWLTSAQLLDATAIGQVTPGPLFTTATFIGYLLSGPTGAVVATLGIFLPAFFFVTISGPIVPRLRRSAVAGAFLDGVNVASLALMVIVTYQLARSAIFDWPTLAMAAASAVALFRYRVGTMRIVGAGALIGLWIGYAFGT